MRATMVILSFLAISLIYVAASSAYEWQTITVDPDVGLCCPSLAIDSNGYPHISYYENYTGQDLRYAYWTGSQWQIEIVDSHGNVGEFNSLALDNQDNPHISYYDRDSNDLKYAFWTGGSWIIQTIDSGDVVPGCLALDSQGYPHIAYCDFANRDVKYAYWDGSNWVIETVDSVGDVGLGISFIMDSQDHAHISYMERVSLGVGALKYAHSNGSSWEVQIVEPYTEGYTYGTCIVVDSQDHPGIIYNCYGLDYAHWDGTEWQFQIVDDHHPADNFSLILDSQDFPNISFWSSYMLHPPGEEWGLFYERWDGSQWEVSNPYAQDDGMDLGDTSITLDGFDNPYIAHTTCDESIGLTWYGYPLAISLLSFTATPQEDSSVLLNWQVEATEGEQIAGFNLYRRSLAADVAESYSFPLQEKDAGWAKINPSLITGQNPYAYTDGDVARGITYEYKLEAVLADESTEILGTASCAPAPPAFAIIKLYPNPASDVLNIALTLPQAGEVTLELYDLTGRVVASKDIPISSPGQLTEQMDVSGLASGVYTLRATQANLSASERVVVVVR